MMFWIMVGRNFYLFIYLFICLCIDFLFIHLGYCFAGEIFFDSDDEDESDKIDAVRIIFIKKNINTLQNGRSRVKGTMGLNFATKRR